jgi:hypothetical protein
MTEQNSPNAVVDDLLQRVSKTEPVPRRRFPRWMILVIILVLIGAGALLYYRFMPLDAPIPDDVGAHYAGLDQGYTEQGFPRLGSTEAPVIVEEFASYACSHCRDFHIEIFPGMLDEIAAGQVQFVLIPVPHIGLGAKSAAKGALCAGQQGEFWKMSDVLFDWQARFSLFSFDERRIRKGAKNMGLDTAAFDRCMDGQDVEIILETTRSAFDRRGLSGTPSFFINGEEVRSYSEFENLGQLAQELSQETP